jgi:hypothetical protein
MFLNKILAIHQGIFYWKIHSKLNITGVEMHLDGIQQNIKIVLLTFLLFTTILKLHAQSNHELHIYKEGVFVGYRHFDKEKIEPMFPFGFGLSYTSFEFSDLKLKKDSMTIDDSLSVSVTVKNMGKIAGDEIVQLYISDKEASVEREHKSLKGFARVNLKGGESKTVTMKIDKSALSFYDVDSKSWVAESGEFEVLVGSSSRDIHLKRDFELK